jgi:hypothetical protein
VAHVRLGALGVHAQPGVPETPALHVRLVPHHGRLCRASSSSSGEMVG